jgi:hypothetical protein
MSSAVMMERTSLGLPGVGVPGVGTPTVGSPSVVPTSSNWLMVPRCTFKFEKCQGGFKVYCSCDDKMATSMVQNLCQMLAGGLFSCYVQYNGMCCCVYNFIQGCCKYETTEQGVCFTCISGDPQCTQMIQACCDSISCYADCGCNCTWAINNTPVCCGFSEQWCAKYGSGSSKSGKAR